MPESLTDPAFVRRLETLALLAKRVLGGKLQANRRTTRKGTGVSFADYAEYHPGDDHRAIDWRVYGRLEHLVIKLFELEEDMTLVLLLDTSASMREKLDYAKRVAAALGFLALRGMDRVAVYAMSDRIEPVLETSHGRAKVMPMLRSLEAVEASGTASRFDAACRTLTARHRRRMMVVPVSDFFFPHGFDRGLSLLRYGRHEVFCVQVQNETDRVCAHRGDAELACVESGRTRRVTVTAAEAAAYEAAVVNWNEELGRACRRRGGGLVSTLDDVPFDDVMQRVLRRGGLVA
ncbi:MAG: DUF58 domain-containing protein [Planctomycetota bacterium]